MDFMFYWIGVATVAIGSVGALSILLMWAIDAACNSLGVSKLVIQAMHKVHRDKRK